MCIRDRERGLLFNLRSAFVQTLQAKAVLQVSKENLDYYDHVLKISRDRFEAGDIAQIDLDRLELQRVQYESDVQTAEVNLRTAKIQMLMLLNDRTPIEQFDLVGVFDFNDQIEALDFYRQTALDNRPDLKAAIQSVAKAQTEDVYKRQVISSIANDRHEAGLRRCKVRWNRRQAGNGSGRRNELRKHSSTNAAAGGAVV